MPTPEEGQKDSISSGGIMKLKLYRQVTCITHSPGDERGRGDVSRKDIGRAVGYFSLKPTVVAAVLSGSAKERSSPFPTPRRKATT